MFGHSLSISEWARSSHQNGTRMLFTNAISTVVLHRSLDSGARRIWDIRGITAGLLKKNIRLNIPSHLCVIIMWENWVEFLWSWVSRSVLYVCRCIFWHGNISLQQKQSLSWWQLSLVEFGNICICDTVRIWILFRYECIDSVDSMCFRIMARVSSN